MTYTRTVQLQTGHTNEMIDITNQVMRVVEESGIQSGAVTIFVPHTTAAVTINENADPDVKKDMLVGLERISPNLAQFRHLEGNSHVHIKSSLVGVDQTVLFEDRNLILGTWQGIYFCEFDGPRTRKCVIRVTD